MVVVSTSLTVDPGSSGCAWTLWPTLDRQVPPMSVRVWKPAHLKGTWLNRAEDAALAMGAFATQCNVKEIYCEEPKFFNEGAANDGALVKLSYAVGCLGMVARYIGATFQLVPVAQWMGQLKDFQLQRRVTRILGMGVCESLGITSHGWDAVGIGLYKQGRFA